MITGSTISQRRELSSRSSNTCRPWPELASADKFSYGICTQKSACGSIPASEPLQVTFQQQYSNDSVDKPCAMVCCQALGCQERLTKSYCIKKRVCAAHLQAESVQLSDSTDLWRFCQQCGKFELLSKFDDSKRSCRARLAKRRSGTRAQRLKELDSMRATSKHKVATEQAADATIHPDVCQQRCTADPVMQLPTPDSNLGIASTDGSACPALHFSHQMQQQQQQQWLRTPDECNLEAWLLEGDSTATAAVTILPAGGHCLSSAPLIDTAMKSPGGIIPAAAAASGALMSLGMQQQAALAQTTSLEVSDIGEEGNMDDIVLQDDVVSALQQELGHNQQPPEVVSFQQTKSPMLPAGGSSSSGGRFMASGPAGGGDSSRIVHVACVTAPAVAGRPEEPAQCHHCAGPLWKHKMRPRSPMDAISAFTAVSRLAPATHEEGLLSVSTDHLRQQSGAMVTDMCGSCCAAAACTMAQQSPQAAAAVAPSLEYMQQQIGSNDPNSRANSNNTRLHWLMQQLQHELQQCDHDDLYDLEDEELNMLLLTALTPTERVDAQQVGPATAGAHKASASSHQGCNLQRCAGHLHQRQQQVWVGSGARSSAAWPHHTTPDSMPQPKHQTAALDRSAASAVTMVVPPAVSSNLTPSAIAATAIVADTWCIQQQQQQTQQQLVPPSLGLPCVVHKSAPSLPGLIHDCSGDICLGWPVGVPAHSIRPAVGRQGDPRQLISSQPGVSHQHCQHSQSIIHERQHLQKQQGYMQMPGWWQQQQQYV